MVDIETDRRVPEGSIRLMHKFKSNGGVGGVGGQPGGGGDVDKT